MKGSGKAMSLAFVTLALVSTLYAQANGTMSGYVRDASGSAVPGAKVTATLLERGTSSVTETDIEGFYNFTALEPGAYTLTVEKAGFRRYEQQGLTLTVRQNLRVDAQVVVGTLAQTVTVTSQVPIVDTTSGTVSGLVDDRRIVDLPLNGRNVMGLAEIVPGVLNVSAPQIMADTRSGPEMNVNGGRGDMNSFTFDGAYFINPARNTGVNYPPPDALQEFRIETANFDSQYGRNSGSQVTVVAKSGTNGFHGDVFEFLRNDAFNARNFFSSTVPALKQNQFGGTAGGPIKKDKLFYFGSFQGLIDNPQAVSSEAFVPSTSERNGDFTALLPGTTLTDPVNPVTGFPMTTTTGAPCVAGNIITPSCISPVTKNLLQYIPQSATGSVVTLVPSPIRDYNYLGRIDASLSPKNTLIGHVYVDHNTQLTVPGDVGTYQHVPVIEETDMVTLNDTYTFKPNLVNQAIVSYLRESSTRHPDLTLVPSDLGMNLPEYWTSGVPTFNISDLLSLANQNKNLFVSNNYEFRDAITWMKGRHTFQAGGELMLLQFLQRYISPPSFSFSGSRSGNPFSDFMLGAYTGLNLTFGQPAGDARSKAPSFFFQDTFKATPRLTLTYGVRWEPDLFYTMGESLSSTFQAGAQSTVIPDAPPGILFAGDSGIPATIAPADLNNFAPRVGFAWDVFGNDKTSVRGAYGVFFNQINADANLSYSNPPNSGTAIASNGLLTDPFGSVGQVPPPVHPQSFGCVKIPTFPGLNCPLFPLPLFGYFTMPNLETPYIQGWNLNIQHQLTPNTMLQVAYIGNVGIKLNNLRNFNPALFIPGTTYNTTTGLETPNSTLQNVNNRTVYEPGIISPTADIIGNDFRSWYHSFQAQLIRRLSKGVSVNASYTLAKSIDMCSLICEACGCVSNPNNLHSIIGRSNWDRRNAFVASFLWSPTVHFNRHWKNTLLNGWTMSGITTIQSGMPMTFVTGVDDAVNGTINAGSVEHAFLDGQPIALNHPNRGAMVNEFFNTAAFVKTTCGFVPEPGNPQVIEQENCTPDGIPYNLLGQYGQSGRNILSGPAFSNTDAAIIRDFAFSERYKAQFRVEFFNLFNQVNFSNPGTTVSSGAFGHIRSAQSGRVGQFAIKFFW